MPSTPSLCVVLVILLATGCAKVVPYPPVTRDREPGETLLAQSAEQDPGVQPWPVRTAEQDPGVQPWLAQIDEQDPGIEPWPAAQFDEQDPDAETWLAETDELDPDAEPWLAQTDEQDPDAEPWLAQIDEQEAPAAGKPIYIQANDGKFWQQLRGDFLQPDIQHASVSKQTALYAKHPQPIEQTLKRGEPYLAYIRHEVAKRGLPGEVVLLPFVESGYNPFAYSQGRAAGLWQFIPSTGSYFGLKQDWWYDGRRDVVASTDAALKYLDKLQKQFNGDWLLTFAAYNAGGGTVRNAIKRNRKAGKPTDFWHLELPKETTAYVPKLLAICRIIDKPEKYGVELPLIDSAPVFAIMETGDQLDIEVAAEMAEMETDAFQRINPGFNRWATHPDGPHQLAIPVDKAHTFAKNLSELPASDHVNWIRHKTVKGETLSHIALRYQTTVKALQQSNGLYSSKIRAGSYLLVPIAEKGSTGHTALNKVAQHSNADDRKITHKVQAGDSLWVIAHRNQISVAQLKKWNQLKSGSVIKPGQQLVLWKDSDGLASGEHLRTLNYAVRSGDSLYDISKKFSVSIADLQRWNKLHKDGYLQPGQNLTVHVDITRLTSN